MAVCLKCQNGTGNNIIHRTGKGRNGIMNGQHYDGVVEELMLYEYEEITANKKKEWCLLRVSFDRNTQQHYKVQSILRYSTPNKG